MVDNIDNFGQYHKDTGEHSMDFDWGDFVESLFHQPPKDPFTFRMEFLDQMDTRGIGELLGGVMLVKGAKYLYNKEIAQLNSDEINNLQKYYRSIGFEVEYDVKSKLQFVKELNKNVPVNYFEINFKPCSQLLNNYNKSQKIIS